MLEIIRSLLMSFVAVAVLLPVVRYAIRRLSPPRHHTQLRPDEVKYAQKQDRKLMIFYFLFASALAVICAGALAMVSSILHMSGEALYVLTPNFRAMFAPGLLLGLTLAVLPLRAAQKSLLAQEYDLYKSYLQQQEGRASNRLYNILLVIMLLISCVVIWLSLRWHVVVTENDITVTRVLQEQRTYTMQQIAASHYLGKEGEYLITFHDQTSLNTAYLKPVQIEMMALLAEKSGKRVIR